LVNLKTKSAGDGYPKKAIEKTVLRLLGSRTFSHGLDPLRAFAPEFLHRLTGFLSARRATSTTLWTRAAAGLEVLTGLALIVGLGAFSSVPT